ncbi:MAG: RNA polymerase sigma factor [Candidatus Dormibacteraeota bacterium]|nr:RNA polymerase sigma factor [Candidatus Dormibacteraeota bacterium]
MEPALASLIQRCRAGDRDAFDGVVDRYGLRVLRTARLIVRDEALAEDVCQETFLKAWRQIRTLRDEDPGPWINRIATNEAISACRRRDRFQGLAERFAWFGNPRREVQSEEGLDLAGALGRLAPELRAVVVLRYFQDLSVEDTAKAVGAPVDTVKSRLKVALRRLRILTGSDEVNE